MGSKQESACGSHGGPQIETRYGFHGWIRIFFLIESTYEAESVHKWLESLNIEHVIETIQWDVFFKIDSFLLV